MSEIITFEPVPPAGTINMSIGQPSADLLPLDLIREASDAFFRQAKPLDLNYGPVQGDERFLNSLAEYLSDGYGASINAESLFVSGGNSQALDFVCTVFSKPGDTIFVEEPGFFLAFQIFRDHGLNIVSIPVDENGLEIDKLQAQLEHQKAAFVYTIPSYHNPGGQSLSAARREKLIDLSRKHDFLIVADEVYQLLSYFKTPLPAFGTKIDCDRVLSLGSFSKILAPGLRLGWIQTSPGLRQKLLANGFVNSGGSINHYTSQIVRLVMDLGLQAAHVEKLCRAYRLRVEAMDEALRRDFGGLAQWRRPDGGYFFWLKFDDAVDTAPLREKARKHKTGFLPGALFSNRGGLRNCLRLSFAHYNEDEIRQGVARLRPLFD